MTAPQPPEAAVEAGRRALYGAFQSGQPDSVRVILTAALPHLHRDWLEGLIEKLEGKQDSAKDSIRWAYLRFTVELLRAELVEGGREE